MSKKIYEYLLSIPNRPLEVDKHMSYTLTSCSDFNPKVCKIPPLLCGFSDRRTPYAEPSPDEEFWLLSGETEDNISDGHSREITMKRWPFSRNNHDPSLPNM